MAHWHLDYRDKPIRHEHVYAYKGHEHSPDPQYPGGYEGYWLSRVGAEMEAARRKKAKA